MRSLQLSRVPWAARRSSQSTLKEINPEYSLEGPALKLQYLGHLMWRADSLEKTLRLGKLNGKRRRGQQRTRWLDGITDSMDMSLSKLRESVGHGSLVCYSPWGFRVRQLSNWTTVKIQKSPVTRVPHTTFMLLSFSKYFLEHRLCTGSVLAAEDMMNDHRWFLPCGAYNPGYFSLCCVRRLGLLV